VNNRPSPSESQSGLTPPTVPSPDAESGPGSQAVVLLWETRLPRVESIGRILAEDGFRPHWIRTASEVKSLCSSPGCRVAAVALGKPPSPGDVALDVGRSLKEKGFRLVCYEDGANAWPLRTRCQALLAGAICVLDSAATGFTRELRNSLRHLVEEEARKNEDEARIKTLMKGLGLVGRSEPMVSVFWSIQRASVLSDLPTLIMGETGTGKELVARAIHRLDPKRCHGPFIPVNCGAISSNLAESEFFGHCRGAFTGADQNRKGLIRAAHGGVLFLDEIGELEPALQTKLLRVLQEGRVMGVGEDNEAPVSVRVIAASNRDLKQMVKNGTFRDDLFHRLNVLSVQIPPLRDRKEDIEPLVTHFLNKYQSLSRSAPLSAAVDFISALMQVDLPGNARQLENLIRQALVNADRNAPLTLADLPAELWQQICEHEQTASSPPHSVKDAAPAADSAPAKPPDRALNNPLTGILEATGWSLERSLQHCERLLVESALRMARGNQSQTAKLLGITPRSVYNKVRKHNLSSRR
jgi:DNA-binding NtrC family response regulator